MVQGKIRGGYSPRRCIRRHTHALFCVWILVLCCVCALHIYPEPHVLLENSMKDVSNGPPDLNRSSGTEDASHSRTGLAIGTTGDLNRSARKTNLRLTLGSTQLGNLKTGPIPWGHRPEYMFTRKHPVLTCFIPLTHILPTAAYQFEMSQAHYGLNSNRPLSNGSIRPARDLRTSALHLYSLL